MKKYLSLLKEKKSNCNLVSSSDNKIYINSNGKIYSHIEIEICKDCEYRYMCVDDRLPVQISNDRYKFLPNAIITRIFLNGKTFL